MSDASSPNYQYVSELLGGYVDDGDTWVIDQLSTDLDRLESSLRNTKVTLAGAIKDFNKVKAENERLRQKYEELRSVVDDGSESMTHEDAVGEVKGMRQRVTELEDQITELPTIIRRYQKDAQRWSRAVKAGLLTDLQIQSIDAAMDSTQ